ncbi:HNH endonuclease signature motif containing protein, partial [Planotetraspora thailandica]|uniref:HNH endonuclease signature motif containing protein n=1 Tax=Planotetraspora thailandica TaxID=487172 RepID=UPI0035E4FE97
DRACTAPGCRAPATTSELDHIDPYGRGGLTVEDNLEAACSHDHDLRDHGWQVARSPAGQTTWISRTGHHYPVTTPPVIEPCPEPLTPHTTYGQDDTTTQAHISAETDITADLGFLPSPDTPIWWETPERPDPALQQPARAGREPAEKSRKPSADDPNDVPPF